MSMGVGRERNGSTRVPTKTWAEAMLMPQPLGCKGSFAPHAMQSVGVSESQGPSHKHHSELTLADNKFATSQIGESLAFRHLANDGAWAQSQTDGCEHTVYTKKDAMPECDEFVDVRLADFAFFLAMNMLSRAEIS
ncbi:unnamed protein product [Effrenium voratum]|nr:unnamed protein product [Effrenium voratum]